MINYDFHIHSCLSPCADDEMTPNNIINMAKIMGIDAIAISDHNSVLNVKPSLKIAESVGIKVIPAMEVETQEEVHILTLFPDYDSADYVYKFVYEHLPSLKNKPEIFGNQLIVDENDNVISNEEKMLIAPSDISIEQLFNKVREAGGVFIPAHVDRHSYSILTNLGFIPDDLKINTIEISKKTTDLNSYVDSRPDLKKYNIIQSSDAHNLESMASIPNSLDCDIGKILEKLR